MSGYTSLLWPENAQRIQKSKLSERAIADLGLEHLTSALTADRWHKQAIRSLLLHLCTDLDVITYRQAILTDLLDNPDLVDQLEKLLPKITALDVDAFPVRPGQAPLYEIVWRIGQLETYAECIQGLKSAFDDCGKFVQANALCALRDLVMDIERGEVFQNLVNELPDLVSRVRNISSVTIGVNLDDQLRPSEATLLSINKERFRGESSSLLRLFFGKGFQDDEMEGIAQLHSVSQEAKGMQAHVYGIDFSNPMMYPLFRDLSQVMKQVTRPVANTLQRYMKINARFLDTLQMELTFYIGAARLIQQLQTNGIPMCRPEIVDQEARVCELEETYNLNLALRLLPKADGTLQDAIVRNDVQFGDQGRIFILTGPNQGGKTTYTQAVGLIQVLAQAGLYVPGKQARISPVDNIFTHFPVEERPEMEAGRLGEESKRLSEIFEQATRHSLVLLNESLASTNFSESLYLAQDIVRILRLLGVRAIFATHLHELAAGVDELNAEANGDSKIVSLVSLIDEQATNGQKQTFKIIPSPPMGHSYAREIAARYGISYQ